jgi:hypothetical protein
MRPTLPQKFHLAYHLVIGGGQLWNPLLATPTAPEALHGSGQVREAWTDVGKNAVVRRADLRRSDTFSQISSHLGLDPVSYAFNHTEPAGPNSGPNAQAPQTWGETDT